MSEFDHLKRVTKELFQNALPRAEKPGWLSKASVGEKTSLQLNAKQALTTAVALTLLNELVHCGGFPVSPSLPRSVLKLLGKSIPKSQKRQVHEEVAQILDWMSAEMALLPPNDEPWPTWHETETDLDQHMAVIKRAIERKQDIEIQYYSHWRREMTNRRISPLKLDNARYLHAYCHLRRDERVFRLSRIHDVASVAPGTPLPEPPVDHNDEPDWETTPPTESPDPT